MGEECLKQRARGRSAHRLRFVSRQKEEELMTIYELGVEYGAAATMLRGRISELEQALEETRDEAVKQQLEGRIRPLRVMYRETRAVARHLQGYYLRTGALKRRGKGGGRK